VIDWEKAVEPASTHAKVDNAGPLAPLDKEGSDLCPCDQTTLEAETMRSGSRESLALYGRRLSYDRFTLAGESISTPTVELDIAEPYSIEKRTRRTTIGGSDMVDRHFIC